MPPAAKKRKVASASSRDGSKLIYYHNPRCSKSRQGLEALKSADVEVEVKEYLKAGLDRSEVQDLFQKLDVTPLEGAVRLNEAKFKEMKIKKSDVTEEEWVDMLVEHPILLERPILVTETEARVGRPAQHMLELIKKS
eukprot:TRINITY_DN14315_c1_g1_i1.p1 TRINITY_DN14315_c1_g1~~TRINITY_DN14315_c1_g1_i1.p1  ORF type:complete len:138 (+),score=25.29 TRINITY_DN14315_c1_g1_i1:49-462(+)